jgi:hypothetical protein
LIAELDARVAWRFDGTVGADKRGSVRIPFPLSGPPQVDDPLALILIVRLPTAGMSTIPVPLKLPLHPGVVTVIVKCNVSPLTLPETVPSAPVDVE